MVKKIQKAIKKYVDQHGHEAYMQEMGIDMSEYNYIKGAKKNLFLGIDDVRAARIMMTLYKVMKKKELDIPLQDDEYFKLWEQEITAFYNRTENIIDWIQSVVNLLMLKQKMINQLTSRLNLLSTKYKEDYDKNGIKVGNSTDNLSPTYINYILNKIDYSSYTKQEQEDLAFLFITHHRKARPD